MRARSPVADPFLPSPGRPSTPSFGRAARTTRSVRRRTPAGTAVRTTAVRALHRSGGTLVAAQRRRSPRLPVGQAAAARRDTARDGKKVVGPLRTGPRRRPGPGRPPTTGPVRRARARPRVRAPYPPSNRARPGCVHPRTAHREASYPGACSPAAMAHACRPERGGRPWDHCLCTITPDAAATHRIPGTEPFRPPQPCTVTSWRGGPAPSTQGSSPQPARRPALGAASAPAGLGAAPRPRGRPLTPAGRSPGSAAPRRPPRPRRRAPRPCRVWRARR